MFYLGYSQPMAGVFRVYSEGGSETKFALNLLTFTGERCIPAPLGVRGSVEVSDVCNIFEGKLNTVSMSFSGCNRQFRIETAFFMLNRGAGNSW